MRFPFSASRQPTGPLRSSVVLVTLLASFFSAGLLLAPAAAAAAEESPAPRDQREQTARRHYAQGEAAFKAEQFDVALQEFEAGYAASPRPGFLLNLGQTERKLGNLRKARSFYKKFLLIDPTSALADQVKAIIAELDSALADEVQAQQSQDPSAQPVAASEEDDHPGTAPARSPLPAAPAVAPPLALPAAPAPAAAHPSLLSTTQPRAPADQPSDRSPPVYRRAWFWVTVGAVAVAGGGAALYASQRSTGDPFHASGTLGALGP